LDLEPFIEADPEFDLKDFYPQALEAFRWEGKLWGLPVTVSPQVIFYNKELFNQAGVEYPEPDWTWDAFLSKVSLLTSEDEKQYGFLDMPLDSQYVVPLSILFPVIVSRTGSLSEFPLSFDDPRMVNAVEWYFSNIRWELEIPPVSEDERKNLIMEGKVAMWIDLARQAGYYRSKLRERYEIGVVPLPGGKTRAAAFLYDGYFISQKSEHPGECWKWIKYLSMHLLPEEYGGWGLPAFQPLAESPQLWEKLGEEVQAYHECLQYEAISSPALFGDYPAFYHRWEAFIKALKRIAQGADIEATLRKAETSIVEPRE
jgi:multiple sugar transport system substrate-binding protein